MDFFSILIEEWRSRDLDKRILVAIVLSIGVLVGFQYVQSLMGGSRESGRQEGRALQKESGKPADVARPADAVARPVGGGASPRGTMVKVETPLYTAVLASEGGGRIVRWDLKRYHARRSNGGIGLVAERDELPLTLRIPAVEGAALPFSVDREELVLKEGSASQVLRFRHSTSAGRIERSLTFHPETYEIDVETTVLGYPSYAVSLGSNTAVIDDLDSGNWNVYVGPAARVGRDVRRESLTKGSGSEQLSGEAGWAAITD
ncbi:MAG: membrane protein insertase YidC, partial [Nitrospirae bacterium]|nr:membrane protein insertase YidC [Nitrospirota bacterium]